MCQNHMKDIKEAAGTWSLIWSMDRIPEQIISALVETKEGMTRPGQSQRHRPASTYSVCNTNKSHFRLSDVDVTIDLNSYGLE